MAEFKCLGYSLQAINHNHIHGEFKSRLNWANVCYQNISSSLLLVKHVEIRMYKTTILSVVLYRYETWCLSLEEEHRLKGFEQGRRKQPRRMQIPFRPSVKWDQLSQVFVTTRNTKFVDTTAKPATAVIRKAVLVLRSFACGFCMLRCANISEKFAVAILSVNAFGSRAVIFC
jgi:hypothetical protein